MNLHEFWQKNYVCQKAILTLILTQIGDMSSKWNHTNTYAKYLTCNNTLGLVEILEKIIRSHWCVSILSAYWVKWSLYIGVALFRC